jgi:hypothetical protein
MDTWGQYFSELLNSNSESSGSENIEYEGAESYIEVPSGDEVFEVTRALKIIKHQGKII